jgi:hypothetical protein
VSCRRRQISKVTSYVANSRHLFARIFETFYNQQASLLTRPLSKPRLPLLQPG